MNVISVPDDIESFFDQYDIEEESNHSQSNLQDMLFDPAQTEMARERAFARMTAFDDGPIEVDEVINSMGRLNVKLAEVAIKVRVSQFSDFRLTRS